MHPQTSPAVALLLRVPSSQAEGSPTSLVTPVPGAPTGDPSWRTNQPPRVPGVAAPGPRAAEVQQQEKPPKRRRCEEPHQQRQRAGVTFPAHVQVLPEELATPRGHPCGLWSRHTTGSSQGVWEREQQSSISRATGTFSARLATTGVVHLLDALWPNTDTACPRQLPRAERALFITKCKYVS